MKKLLLVSIIFSACLGLHADEIIVPGKLFGTGSQNTSVQGDGALLTGFFSYGTAVYEFAVPTGTERFKLDISFDNLKDKQLKIYVFNHGTKADDDAVRNRSLAANWRLWASTGANGKWLSENPEYITAKSGDNLLDYLGTENKVKILLFAHGGIPYISDARFLVHYVKLSAVASETDSIASAELKQVAAKIITSQNAWIEGGFLLVRGIGKTSPGDDPADPATAAKARRAATVVAYRNLAVALRRMPLSGGTASIPGSTVRESKTLADGNVEVILEIPLANIEK